jgi:hypothetical protein
MVSKKKQGPRAPATNLLVHVCSVPLHKTPKSELLKIENFAMANNWKIIIELDSLYNYKLATYSSKYIIYLCQGMCSQCQHPCIISLLGFFTLTILVPFSLKKINMRKAKNLFVAKQHRPCLDKQLN